jgi:ParB family transcriptional regulator, chromosome partitioning protein
MKKEVEDKDRVRLLKMGDIIPNPNQPRQHFDEEELKELAESIKADGLKVPICVRDLCNNDGNSISSNKYEIVDGERRYRVHKLLGYPEIKAIIDKTVQSQKEAMKQSLIMNLQRSDLSPQDKETAIFKLCQPVEEQGGGMSTREVAAVLGKSHGAIDNVIRAYKARQTLPTIVGATASTAVLNLTSFIKDENIRIGILKMISEGRMKVEYNTIKHTVNMLKQTTRAAQEEYFAGNLSLLQLEELLRQDEYNVILADPYSSFTDIDDEEEIKRLGMSVPFAENALLFVWIPSKKLQQGFELIHEWGFRYTTSAVWIDERQRLDKAKLIEQGHYYVMKEDPNIQYYNETYFLFICKKGVGLGTPVPAHRQSSVLNHAKCCQGLTEKADVAHAVIEITYPAYAYRCLEVLTKNSKPRDGWKVWGAEALLL